MLGGILLFNSKHGDEKNKEKSGVFGIIRGSLIGVASAFLSALVFTLVALMNEDPEKLAYGLAYAALAIGALMAGVASEKEGINPALASFLSGVGYVLIIWLASIPFRADGDPGISPVVSLLVYLGCAAVSAVFGLLFRRRPATLASMRRSPAAAVRKQLGNRG